MPGAGFGLSGPFRAACLALGRSVPVRGATARGPRPRGRASARRTMGTMRLLFLGDVVGRPGRLAVAERLPELRERWRLDGVVINGENAAGGFGITEAICDDLLIAGADAVTLGNHSWDQREALVFIERQPRLVRPANFPPGTPAGGAAMVETRNGARVLVLNLMGRLYMDALDDPFAVADRTLEATPLREV